MNGRKLRRGLAWSLLAVVVGAILFHVVAGWTAFGKRPSGERLVRMARSPERRGEVFVNREPLENDLWLSLKDAFAASPHTSPSAPIPLTHTPASRFATPPASGLRLTWLGHSTTLIEIDGRRVLTDPIWSKRASPFSWIGPQRFYAPPLAMEDVPALDAVVISHDHYDHLDMKTVQALTSRTKRFVVPLGIGSHLAYWGVPEAQIVELDWWERVDLGGVELVAAPARHASGRVLIDNDTRLWAGYAMLGPKHRAYYSGDTGLFPAMREIGERLGPFDVTLLEAGQYGRSWPDWHLGPEQAVVAHQWLRGRVLVPVHWAGFALAYHGWTEPVERVLAAAGLANVTVLAPMPGQSVEPDAPLGVTRWWPEVPWKTGAEDPIRATHMPP